MESKPSKPRAPVRGDAAVSVAADGAWHQRFGWWSLFVFAALGLALEFLHGFKIQAYLAVSNETRRLMWTLAHAHGALIGLIHVVFGVSLAGGQIEPRLSKRISWSLIAATVLLPGGFFAAGITFYSGDPGVGIAVVPAGAIALLVALFTLAQAAGRSR